MRLALFIVVHHSSLFRREAWERVGGYREHFRGNEDWNFWLNLVAAGYRWEVVPEVLLYYRRHGPSRSHGSLRNRIPIMADVIDDNRSFYREHHKQLLLDLYAKYIELDDVWREKDRALADNAVLARQLAAEQSGRAAAEAEYRSLESEYRKLGSAWQEKDRALADNAVLARQLAAEQSDHAAALAEYRKLERYCRALEQELAEGRDDR